MAGYKLARQLLYSPYIAHRAIINNHSFWREMNVFLIFSPRLLVCSVLNTVYIGPFFLGTYANVPF